MNTPKKLFIARLFTILALIAIPFSFDTFAKGHGKHHGGHHRFHDKGDKGKNHRRSFRDDRRDEKFDRKAEKRLRKADKKAEKFVNGHDARDGRFDGRGPKVGENCIDCGSRDDRFSRQDRNSPQRIVRRR